MFQCFYERGSYSIPYSAISPIITYINEHSYTKGNLNLEPSVNNEWWLILSLKNKWELAFRIFTDKDDWYYKYLFNRKLQITLAGKVYQREGWMVRHTNEIYNKQYPRTAHSGISVKISYNF